MRQLFIAPAATFDGARMVPGELVITENCCRFSGAGITREMTWDSLADVEATVMEVTVPGTQGPRKQSALLLKNGSQTQLWMIAAQPAHKALDAIALGKESLRAAADAAVTKQQDDAERIRALEARAAEAEERAAAAEDRAEKAEARAAMAETRAERAEARVKSLCSQLATSEEKRLAAEAALAREEEESAAEAAEAVRADEEPAVPENAAPVEEPAAAEEAEKSADGVAACAGGRDCSDK
jgi:hypothetical protein